MLRFAVATGFCLVSLVSLAAPASEPVQREERDLIAIVNLSDSTGKWHYRYEENRAANKIRNRLKRHYRKIHLFEKKEATRKNLMAAIRETENNPAVKATDVIIYVHGTTGSIGFVDGWYSSSTLAKDIIRMETDAGGPPRKLRALYSDACYGETHNKDWLHAGFRAALGSVGVDSNWSIDLGKFIRSWKRGKDFQYGVKRANSGWRSGVMDDFIDGNSTKLMEGDGAITIETPVL